MTNARIMTNDADARYSLEFSNHNFEADSHQQGPPSIAPRETVYSSHDTGIGDSNDRQEMDSDQECIVTPHRSGRSSSILSEKCSNMVEEDKQVDGLVADEGEDVPDAVCPVYTWDNIVAWFAALEAGEEIRLHLRQVE